MSGLTRRSLLRVSGGLLGTGLFAGCVGEFPIGGDDASTEATTGKSIPTATTEGERTRTAANTIGMPNLTDNDRGTSCDSDLSRFEAPIDEVQYDSLGEFKLTVSRRSVGLSDRITFRLQNTTGNQRTTGVREMNDVQRRTDDGWQSIYWVTGIMSYPAKGVIHS
jgi:hypothetical protein